MKFTAVDVETANGDPASICQVGAAEYYSGALVHEWKTYVDPQDWFDGFNVGIHGIDEAAVAGAPTFPEIVGRLQESMSRRIVCAHTGFDRRALQYACLKYELPEIKCTWLDTARVCRRSWPECGSRYRLKYVAKLVGYEFQHHDALEDAKASAHILLAAIAATGIDLEGWLKRVEQPLDLTATIAREGNPEGVLYGEVLVFTGALGMTRREAAALAAHAGCTVKETVNENTTVIVVGDQDLEPLAGHEKSAKQRKAEQMIIQGHPLEILGETEFLTLIQAAEKKRPAGQ
jgi:DNA polymerase-3 subunit epsilon